MIFEKDELIKEDKPYGTVLIKASKILDFLSKAKEPEPLSAIAHETSMTSSTALKILDTLCLIGYTKKHEKTKKFSLGSSLMKFANDYISNLDIVNITYPFLRDLRDSLEETIHLGVPEGDRVVYVNKFATNKPIVCISSKIGSSIPMYSSSMGKAILSCYNEEKLDEYFKNVNFIHLAKNTKTNEKDLRDEIKNIKETGIAIDDEENVEDVYCAGSAIFYKGEIYGAFSASIPKYRINNDIKKDILINMIKETRENIIFEIRKLHKFI